ncbi:MAG: type IIL restriction-modification enzyme MmeI [Thermodesulfobacteriota bacterium]
MEEREILERLSRFIKYWSQLNGKEKGEAQVFCDRLFQAFGHEGYKEAGASLEKRVKGKRRAGWADLRWKDILLLEMKSRGDDLRKHYQQAFEYWLYSTPNRPRYVILCNFDEFWIYDLNQQLDDPVDQIHITELPARHAAFSFLFPEPKPPIFGNNRLAVTRVAADKLAQIFNSFVVRGEERARAQRFILQIVVALFSEDVGLLPSGLMCQLIEACIRGESSYDLIGNLFRQMNSPERARAGRFKEIDYFNGGLFSIIDPIEMTGDELTLLGGGSKGRLVKGSATDIWHSVSKQHGQG